MASEDLERIQLTEFPGLEEQLADHHSGIK